MLQSTTSFSLFTCSNNFCANLDTFSVQGFVTTCAIMIAIGAIISDEHISVKIAGVVVMICVVWYTFVASADALVYRPQQIEIPHESMV